MNYLKMAWFGYVKPQKFSFSIPVASPQETQLTFTVESNHPLSEAEKEVIYQIISYLGLPKESPGLQTKEIGVPAEGEMPAVDEKIKSLRNVCLGKAEIVRKIEELQFAGVDMNHSLDGLLETLKEEIKQDIYSNELDKAKELITRAKNFPHFNIEEFFVDDYFAPPARVEENTNDNATIQEEEQGPSYTYQEDYGDEAQPDFRSFFVNETAEGGQNDDSTSNHYDFSDLWMGTEASDANAAPPMKTQFTLLQWSAKYGSAEFLAFLLAQGANPNNAGTTANNSLELLAETFGAPDVEKKVQLLSPQSTFKKELFKDVFAEQASFYADRYEEFRFAFVRTCIQCKNSAEFYDVVKKSAPGLLLDLDKERNVFKDHQEDLYALWANAKDNERNAYASSPSFNTAAAFRYAAAKKENFLANELLTNEQRPSVQQEMLNAAIEIGGEVKKEVLSKIPSIAVAKTPGDVKTLLETSLPLLKTEAEKSEFLAWLFKTPLQEIAKTPEDSKFLLDSSLALLQTPQEKKAFFNWLFAENPLTSALLLEHVKVFPEDTYLFWTHVAAKERGAYIALDSFNPL